MDITLVWLGFAACSAAIVYSGGQLSRYGDVIADKTGLGRTWIGLILLATVTSLPELVTGISAVTLVHAPDIAVGGVLGSCVFNLAILAAIDIADRSTPLTTKAHHGHILSGGFGLVLLGIVAIGIYTRGLLPPIGWIGSYTFLLLAVYFIAMHILFIYEKRHIAAFVKERVEESRYKDISLRSALNRYSLHALVVIGAAIFLPTLGESIAQFTGLGETFVGSVFIAIVTSLPEVVVSISALRIGAVDLAIGNLFGSNIFNILILAIDDLFYLPTDILSATHSTHLISTISAMVMTAIAIIGLTYRAEKKFLVISWDSIALLLITLGNLMLLYMLRI